MIPENLERARRLFWLGRFLLALGAILLPVIAYGLTTLLVEGHAQKEYFEAGSLAAGFTALIVSALVGTKSAQAD